MPPQKTQPAHEITDGDRLAVLEGLVRHVIEELHSQNEATAEREIASIAVFDQIEAKLDRLMVLADEAAPLLESPVAKFMAQRRARRVLSGKHLTPEQVAAAEQESRARAAMDELTELGQELGEP